MARAFRDCTSGRNEGLQSRVLATSKSYSYHFPDSAGSSSEFSDNPHFKYFTLFAILSLTYGMWLSYKVSKEVQRKIQTTKFYKYRVNQLV